MLKQEAICCILAVAKPQLVCPSTTACRQFMQAALKCIDWSARSNGVSLSEAHTDTQLWIIFTLQTLAGLCSNVSLLIVKQVPGSLCSFNAACSFVCGTLELSISKFPQAGSCFSLSYQICAKAHSRTKSNYAIYDPWLHFICFAHFRSEWRNFIFTSWEHAAAIKTHFASHMAYA